MEFEKSLEKLNIEFLKDKPLKDFTTFKIGGKARYIVFPKTIDELIETIKLANKSGVYWKVLGNFSNVLVSDRGFDGAIIITTKLDFFKIEENVIEAECGCMISQVARKACENGLKGLEFAVGIPGTVGGAVYMNAGAYDGEIKDVFECAEVLDEKLNILKLGKEDMRFSYRHSRLKEEKMILLRSTFRLQYAKEGDIPPLQKANEFNQRRREKQPLQFPSAGSIFKRPAGYFAGKLIEDAGLKGYRIGNACISEKHAGFIVNLGGASAEDVRKLIFHVQRTVYEKFGVLLEPEIEFIGEFETPFFEPASEYSNIEYNY
ncbi:UDP-N-acetylmuramate dehydrogenase [Caldicellulosiruptor naganoensis]|uniref:UDP-N-acetylenolpyruvoylglucosamine reductase n=1 Tax=Caldicellulosiruptor naganoensis TaxID=29324 RepID=A0ABY7BIK4_9FIRM|nr:UDP-N-acetylmuramate dehydrogenase [Caldicellulosiruptor naganoensis]WAM32659.1 UDP-N-acetylmuramate dehydrogenase [Caldicellulosiruptor naganoensis]